MHQNHLHKSILQMKIGTKNINSVESFSQKIDSIIYTYLKLSLISGKINKKLNCMTSQLSEHYIRVYFFNNSNTNKKYMQIIIIKINYLYKLNLQLHRYRRECSRTVLFRLVLTRLALCLHILIVLLQRDLSIVWQLSAQCKLTFNSWSTNVFK